jgi:hypothetical protein
MNIENLYHASGVIHVHSKYSDGTRAVHEIMDIANELDIDFLLLTDHNTIQAKKDRLEKWYQKVLLGVGTELNDQNDRNHYLAFNLPDNFPFSLDPKQYIKDVERYGGFGIIAHPHESRNHFEKFPPYPWTHWENSQFNGLEIWNQMSEWMEGLTTLNGVNRILHPRRSIITPKDVTLKKWDEISLNRKVVGIGGVDAHGHIYKIFGLIPTRVFRYKISFKTIRTHILSEQELIKGAPVNESLQIVYEAIKNANCFVSNLYYGDASSFRFFVKNDEESASIGQSIAYKAHTKICIKNPKLAKTKIIKNGELYLEKESREIIVEADSPGIYRTESYIKNRPWIFSNHIRIV